MNKEILIGSHVSMSGPEYYLGSVKEAISYGSTTFMFYTGAPQNSIRKPTSELRVAEARELIKQNGFDESKIIVHAPYIINIGNSQNSELYEISKRNLTQELRRVKDFGLSILVLHPGSHVKTGIENGLNSIINALNEIFENDGTDVKIALETMAGKGSELGANFNEIKSIIDGVNKKERIGVCLDTCHISDEGVDVSKVDDVLDEFDKIIGLDKLLCIHINDSKNPRESHKDRHENLGKGEIGFDALKRIVWHPDFLDVPKILETPWIKNPDNPKDTRAPYKEEIAQLRVG